MHLATTPEIFFESKNIVSLCVLVEGLKASYSWLTERGTGTCNRSERNTLKLNKIFCTCIEAAVDCTVKKNDLIKGLSCLLVILFNKELVIHLAEKINSAGGRSSANTSCACLVCVKQERNVSLKNRGIALIIELILDALH